MPDADGLRDAARGVRHDIVADLPELLERFADVALDRGTHVCWAATAAEARDHVARVVADHGDAARGVAVVEADLGQWIAGLADEVPDDLMAPARPEQRQRMHDLFVERAQARPSRRRPDELVRFARERRREQLLGSPVGVTGADLAVADTGSLVLVAHDGDGRLLTALPPVLVVVLGIDRLTASWDQADLLLAAQARSATGRHRPSATTVLTGPRGDGEAGGPAELHVVVLDNGRSRLLAGPEPTLGATPTSWAGHPLAAPAGSTAPGARGGLAGLGPDYGLGLPDAMARTGPVAGPLGEALVGLPLPEVLLALQQEAAHPGPHGGRRGERGERAAWRLWATAWSDARRYSATTRAATWDRWVTRVGGRLPGAATWVPEGEPPDGPPDRFRDRWWKGQV